jgi:hypothetical protein
VKRLYLLVVVGLGFITTGVLAAPTLIRWKIESDHPGVTVASVSLSREGVRLTDVTVNKPAIKAVLKSVTTRDGTSLTVSGGTVELIMGEVFRDERVLEARRDVRGLLDEARVTKGDTRAVATGVSFDQSHVRAERVTISKRGLPDVTVTGACAQRDWSLITADRATVSPHGIDVRVDRLLKHFAGLSSEVRLEKLRAHPRDRSLTIERVAAGTNNLVGVRVDAQEGATLTVAKASLAVPRINVEGLTLERFQASSKSPWEVIDLDVQGAQLKVRPHNLGIEGDQSCSAWVEALPTGLREGPLKSSWAGQLAFSVQVKPEPKLTMKGYCRTTCDAFAPLRSKFTYVAYDASGKEFRRTTGPRSEDWVPFSSMGPALPLSIIALEDPGFPKHRGVIPRALENSLKDDVRLSKFARGGSTITMQLAKNLYLRRDKTLARKAQEILIAMGIEGCFTKDEILELYLNVVEFGPDTYGIKDAADKHFDGEPITLTPDEALYLASILPNPKKAAPFEKAKGRVQSLAKTLMSSGRLPDDAFTIIEQVWETD